MDKKIDRKLLTNIILTSLAFFIFAVIAILVMCDYNFKIDKFNVSVANNRNDFWTSFLKIFTHLGSFYTTKIK